MTAVVFPPDYDSSKSCSESESTETSLPQSLIPKPKRNIGIVEKVGKAMGINKSEFKEFKYVTRTTAVDHLDMGKRYIFQDPQDVQAFKYIMKTKYTKLSKYADAWPVDVYAKLWLDGRHTTVRFERSLSPVITRSSARSATLATRRNTEKIGAKSVSVPNAITGCAAASGSTSIVGSAGTSDSTSIAGQAPDKTCQGGKITNAKKYVRQYVGAPPRFPLLLDTANTNANTNAIANAEIADAITQTTDANANTAAGVGPKPGQYNPEIIRFLEGLNIPQSDCPRLARMLEAKGVHNHEYLRNLACLSDRDTWLQQQVRRGGMSEIQMLMLRAALEKLEMSYENRNEV